MTIGCNIFCDKTTMPSGSVNETDTPVRVHQSTDSPKGAQVNTSIAPRNMSVDHVTRPRRGHDY